MIAEADRNMGAIEDVEAIQSLANEALWEAFEEFERGTSIGCRRGNELSEVFDNLSWHAFRIVWPDIDKDDSAFSQYVQGRYEQIWARRYGEGADK